MKFVQCSLAALIAVMAAACADAPDAGDQSAQSLEQGIVAPVEADELSTAELDAEAGESPELAAREQELALLSDSDELTVLESVEASGSGSVEKAAAGCTAVEINVSGAEAHYTECQSGNTRTVDGWVKDTKADGKCAEVYGLDAAGGKFDPVRACPKNTQKSFFWSRSTSDIRVFLRLVG